MNSFRMFFKRFYWRLKLKISGKNTLLNLLKKPDIDIADLLWTEYAHRVRDIRELMVIVYDPNTEFPKAARLAAGGMVLFILHQPCGFIFMPNRPWFDVKKGRLMHLVDVGLCLPELQREAGAIVRYYFTAKERKAFGDLW